MHHSEQGIGTTSGVGWVAAVATPFNGSLDIVGEVGGNYKTLSVLGADYHLRIYGVLGGVRFTGQGSSGMHPFAQVLLGLDHYSTTTVVGGISGSASGFAFQPGAGITMPLSAGGRNLNLRAQVDFRHSNAGGGGNNNLRFAVGVVFAFGK
jgi:hypothetical protein